MTAKHLRYWEYDREATVECYACGWSGRGSQNEEHFEELLDVRCPTCEVMLLIVSYPTIGETREANGAGNERAVAELPSVNKREARSERADRFMLRDPGQLPEISDPDIEIVWDLEELGDETWTVLRHGDAAIWRELAFWEGYKRFAEVFQIVRERYGKRLREVRATPASALYLYGDSLSALDSVARLNATLARSGVETEAPDVARLVARYASLLHQRVPGHHVASPLGAWLLLALSADTALQAATDEMPLDPHVRADVEADLGCSAAVAGAVARRLLTNAPGAVAASVAAWTYAADVPLALEVAFSRWPAGTATGPIPTQEAADAWVDEVTSGLIKRFPVDIPSVTSLLLASALATRISWEDPFGADDPMPEGSPWAGLGVPLMQAADTHPVRLWTSPHGLLASHRARGGGLCVLSVLAADADVPVPVLLEYAHHLSAADAASEPGEYGAGVPVGGGLAEADIDVVFALPLGRHDVLLVREIKISTRRPGEREVACTASLPAWRASSHLTSGQLPGLVGAAQLLGSRLHSWQSGLGPVDAAQSAIASFDRYGFEAAAITGMTVMAGSGPPGERGLRREVDVRFARPFVTVAAVDDVSPGQREGRHEKIPGDWHGLPVFSAAVSEPTIPQPLVGRCRTQPEVGRRGS